MSKPRTHNQIELRGDHAVIVIPHKESLVEVLIDIADVGFVQSHKWSAGSDGHGYIFIQSSVWSRGSQRTVRLARFLLDAPSGAVVDHEDRNPLNMRRSNLRLVSIAGNNQNTGPRRCNPVGIRGVTLHCGSYRARVQLNGKLHNLGTFATPEDASLAVSSFRAEHMPTSADYVLGSKEQEDAVA